MPYFNILTDRTCQLILGLFEGSSIKELAIEEGISRSRVDQILNKAYRKVFGYIERINNDVAKSGGARIMNIFYSRNYSLTLPQQFIHNAFIYKAFMDCLYVTEGELNLLPVYRALKKHQEEELAKVNDEWVEITRRVCFGESIKSIAEELKMTEFDIAKIVQLTCYRINPDFVSTKRHGRAQDGIDFYRDHKRVFFNPIEIELDISLLKYAPMLDYPENTEK